MKNHVWRPLFVVIGLVVFILLVRMFYVPDDFGAQERGYTFGFHRLGNEQEWKDYPPKYRDRVITSYSIHYTKLYEKVSSREI